MTWLSRLWMRIAPDHQLAIKQRCKAALGRVLRKIRDKVDTRLGDNH